MRSGLRFGAFGLAALGVASLWVYAFQWVVPAPEALLPRLPGASSGSTEVIPTKRGAGDSAVISQTVQHGSVVQLGRFAVGARTMPTGRTDRPSLPPKRGKPKGSQSGTPAPGGTTPPSSPGGTTPPSSPGGTTPPSSPGGATPPSSPGGATPPSSPGGATPPSSPGGTTPPSSPGGITPPTSPSGPVAWPPVDTPPSPPSGGYGGGGGSGSSGPNGTPTDGGRTTAGTPPVQCPGSSGAVTNASVVVSNGVALATFRIAPGCSGIAITLGTYQTSSTPPTLFRTVSGSFDAGGPFALSAAVPGCQYEADLMAGNVKLASASGGPSCAPLPLPLPPLPTPQPPPCSQDTGQGDHHDGGGPPPGGTDTRPGWGWGDNNHDHTGPGGGSGHKGHPGRA